MKNFSLDILYSYSFKTHSGEEYTYFTEYELRFPVQEWMLSKHGYSNPFIYAMDSKKNKYRTVSIETKDIDFNSFLYEGTR